MAVLAYKRRRHVINLFLWPSDPSMPRSSVGETYRGYHLLSWEQQGFTCWAVSDLNAAELEEFARLFREKAAP